MTNLIEELNIDNKKLPHLLSACGMTEEVHDVEALKAVIAMRETGEAKGNRQGYCLYLAQQHGVSADEIHKAIEPMKIKTSDADYLPLYINVCIKVAGGESAAQAVHSEFDSGKQATITNDLPEPIKDQLRPSIKTAAQGIVHDAIGLIGSYKDQANTFVIKELEAEMALTMQTPEVKAATEQLIGGSSPEKLPILEAHVEE